MTADLFDRKGPLLVRNVRLSGVRGDICIDEEGRIEAVGEGAGAAWQSRGVPTIEGDGAIAMPGLVNTHTHAAMTLLRGYADDMVLQEWLEQKIWPLEAHLTGEDVYWGTRLACLEMIRTGTVAFNDLYFFMEEAARAVEEMGMKAVLAYGFIDMFDEARREHEIRATENLVRFLKQRNHPGLKAAVGPHAVYTVSPEGMRWMADFSREEQIGIHLHLSETRREVMECVNRWGVRPAVHLDRQGLLTPRTVAAHGCWLDREECTLLGQKGVSVSYNPQSNMKLAVGRALPYPDLREAGVNVTLGTDGCASNNSLDLFQTVKCASLLQKFFWNRETLLAAPEALDLATRNGARALGTGGGEIAVGADADLILVSPERPCMVPLHSEVSNLVYSCTGSAVDTVICRGRVLMHRRRVPGEEEILRGAARAAERLLSRARAAG